MNEKTPQKVSKLSSCDDNIGIIKKLVCLKSKWNFLLVFLFFGIAFAETGVLRAYEVLERGGEVLLTGSVENAYLKQNIDTRSGNNGLYTIQFNDIRQLHVVQAGFTPLMLDKPNRKLLFALCILILLLLGKMQNNITRIFTVDKRVLFVDRGLQRGYLLKHRSKGLCEMLKNGSFSGMFVVNMVDNFYVLGANARVANLGCLLNRFRFNAFSDLFRDKYDLIVLKHTVQTIESIQDALNKLLTAVRNLFYRRLLSSTSVTVMRGSATVATATMAVTGNFNQ